MKKLTSLVKKSSTAETHDRKIFALDDKPADIIKDKSASNPYSKDMLIPNISVHNDAR